jgi:hypothetical protein
VAYPVYLQCRLLLQCPAPASWKLSQDLVLVAAGPHSAQKPKVPVALHLGGFIGERQEQLPFLSPQQVSGFLAGCDSTLPQQPLCLPEVWLCPSSPAGSGSLPWRRGSSWVVCLSSLELLFLYSLVFLLLLPDQPLTSPIPCNGQ